MPTACSALEWSHRFASCRILRSKEGDDRLSSVTFPDRSSGQSTALTKRFPILW